MKGLDLTSIGSITHFYDSSFSEFFFDVLESIDDSSVFGRHKKR
jgi:hypothetical protein